MGKSKEIDPICKMEVDPQKASKKKYKGKYYYFCSPTCLWAFENDPEQFVKE